MILAGLDLKLTHAMHSRILQNTGVRAAADPHPAKKTALSIEREPIEMVESVLHHNPVYLHRNTIRLHNGRTGQNNNHTARMSILKTHQIKLQSPFRTNTPNKDEIELRGKRTDDSQISLDQQSFGYGYESQMPSDQTRLPLPPLPHSPTLPHCALLEQAGTEYAQDRILTRARSHSIQGTTEPSRSRYEPTYSSEWDSTRQGFSVSPQDITNVIDDPESQQVEPNPGTRLHYWESDEKRRIYYVDQNFETNPREESNYNILRESNIGGDLRQRYPWESRQLIPFQRSQSSVDLENAAPSHSPTSPFIPTRFNLNRRQSIPTQRSTNTKPSTLPPISESTATYPAIHSLRGGDANHGRTNSTGSDSMVSAAPTFQDTCGASPRQRPLWRIGHAGYYRKEDLEELYDLWRSQYESKDSSLLSLWRTGNKDGSMEGSVESERTRYAAEEWGNSSNENVDKGKDAWQDMDTELSFVGRNDIGSREESMKEATPSSREIMSVIDIKDGTAKQDLPARNSDSSEVKIAAGTNQVNDYTSRRDNVEKHSEGAEELRKEGEDEDREFEEKEGEEENRDEEEEESNPNESRQEEIISRDVDGSESDQCQKTSPVPNVPEAFQCRKQPEETYPDPYRHQAQVFA
ncbi:hypothetical protein BGZ80_010587 [Entomortierella chlamydospora]|uniref:Uncharacterized protein n=1 Tax=Entomortierella chlamydospora TaxID=101097 RepID=A0A9P6MVG4_9FUNG|nr:hypothetical protein BGZ80_010587 [Entomortierella chlamydospora]